MTRFPTTRSPIRLLLVDDNPADVMLIQDAFADSEHVTVDIATNGEEALRHLGEATRPDMILLDVQLPGMNGIEVLRSIKQNATLRTIPVLILSSSRHESDIASAYHAHANSYIAKPIGIQNLEKMARTVEDYWLQHARLPPRAQA